MTLKGRMKRVAGEVARKAPAKPLYILTQDLEDPDLYRSIDDKTYRSADLDGLEARYQLIVVVYSDRWPSECE